MSTGKNSKIFLLSFICKDNIHLNCASSFRGGECLKIGYEMLILQSEIYCNTYQPLQ